jgi:LuxR family maltose regulon positive regulatory protein
LLFPVEAAEMVGVEALQEVLDRQTDAVRTFLLDTSVLRELHPDLCRAVSGTSDARGMLRSLERGYVFLVPLDGERQWYRYHHLFADALLARAQALDRRQR